MNSDEQLFDHQDWKQVIIEKKRKPKNKQTNKNQELNKVKKIENKADTDTLHHNKYSREFRIKMVQKRTSTLNMTQKQLASRLNLPEKVIKDIECGNAIYNSDHYNRIRKLLKI
tara:strand:+ start:3424 stop:3765 length:342 start_codon:yes stop_codon:yes gene_type:complete